MSSKKSTKSPVETVRVIPARSHFETFERLANGEPVEGFIQSGDPRYLVRATFTPVPSRSKDSVDGYSTPVFERVELPSIGNGSVRYERGEQAGFTVKANVTFDSGSSTQASFYSSPEAFYAYADAAGFDEERTVSRGRVYVADPEGEVTPLVPHYGARVSLSVFVEGLTGEQAEKIVLDALEGIFGDREVRVRNVRSKDVLDERVNVFTYGTRRGELPEIIAAGILRDEDGYFHKGRSGMAQTQYLPIDEAGRDRVEVER